MNTKYAYTDSRNGGGSMRTKPVRFGFSLLVVIALIGVSLSTTGCNAVRSRRKAPKEVGFLGDYSRLKANPDFPAKLVYINPEAAWTSYNAIEIDSVTLWRTGQTGHLSEEVRQNILNIVYKALHDKLGAQFTIVNQAGPGVLRLRAALTEAKGANVPARTVSTIVPQLHMISMVVGMSADVVVTVGEATVEAEIVDSITGRRLAAAVDQRAGTKAISGRMFKKWGDFEAAAEFWAESLTRTLTKLGVGRKSS